MAALTTDAHRDASWTRTETPHSDIQGMRYRAFTARVYRRSSEIPLAHSSGTTPSGPSPTRCRGCVQRLSTVPPAPSPATRRSRASILRAKADSRLHQQVPETWVALLQRWPGCVEGHCHPPARPGTAAPLRHPPPAGWVQSRHRFAGCFFWFFFSVKRMNRSILYAL